MVELSRRVQAPAPETHRSLKRVAGIESVLMPFEDMRELNLSHFITRSRFQVFGFFF